MGVDLLRQRSVSFMAAEDLRTKKSMTSVVFKYLWSDTTVGNVAFGF